ncbi:MAG: DUF4982 domain-containing protein [Lentisphaeria bacterium]|nr:DUF4982 domain-containing protein [Lentisphaeria bacterium]
MNTNMNKKAVRTACLSLFLILLAGTAGASEIYDFNPGWMFLPSDHQIAPKEYKEHKSIWAGAKAATADVVWPFTAADFDDRDFRPVNLPHDWAVEDGFYPEEDGEQGYRRRGWGYYRKRFFVPSSWKGKRVELQFGGIATHSAFWINQTLFHHNYSGYNTITMDITPTLMFGRENVIAVEVNAAVFEGWWYEGAGIYRDVRLIVSDPVHVATEAGVLVNAEVKIDGWNVNGYVDIVNDGILEASPAVDIDIFAPDGKKVESKRLLSLLPPNQTTRVPYSIRIAAPKTWSPDTPALYQLKVTIKNETRVFDEKAVNFGFRSFKFDFTNGFTLNGKPMKLKGVCNHQDHAGVGAAVPAAIEEFRIKKLKEMGANAYRCSHNPPSENILDLCDKYGLLVIDENRAFNAGPDWLNYVRAHVRRDRNHPSVIAWSIFNEEPLQGEFRGQEIARALVNAVKAEDSTRPVLAAMNGGFFSKEGARNVLDIVGFNYQYGQIDRFHSEYPNIPILLTEGASAFETRGALATDREKNIASSYDDFAADWGTTHRKDWEAVMKRRFLAGTFVWTGFDYHGEPTPFNNRFPANSSYFGCMDLCGFPKTAFYIRQAQWLDKPVLQTNPGHWNHEGKEGQEIDVFCATNVEEVSFILNGNNIGTFKVDPFEMLTHKVPYEPGSLLLVGRKGGQEVIRTQIETTGKPVELKLIPDRTEIGADGCDAVPVTVCAVDASGRIVPDADFSVEFEVSGPGRNIGVGNGDPTCILSEKADSRPLFNGYAQLIVQSVRGKKGTIEITAKSEGLKSATCSVKTVSAAALPVVEGFLNHENTVDGWLVTLPVSEKPDIMSADALDEINGLSKAKMGEMLTMKPKDWMLFYNRYKLPRDITENGGSLCFKNMTGKAEIFLDGELILEKKSMTAGDVVVRLKKGLDTVGINVRMQPDSKGHILLGDIVYVTPEKLKKSTSSGSK